MWFLLSAVLFAVGALGMMVRARQQKRTVMVWLFGAILVADVIASGLVVAGRFMR